VTGIETAPFQSRSAPAIVVVPAGFAATVAWAPDDAGAGPVDGVEAVDEVPVVVTITVVVGRSGVVDTVTGAEGSVLVGIVGSVLVGTDGTVMVATEGTVMAGTEGSVIVGIGRASAAARCGLTPTKKPSAASGIIQRIRSALLSDDGPGVGESTGNLLHLGVVECSTHNRPISAGRYPL
jgi:hypothetical protein